MERKRKEKEKGQRKGRKRKENNCRHETCKELPIGLCQNLPRATTRNANVCMHNKLADMHNICRHFPQRFYIHKSCKKLAENFSHAHAKLAQNFARRQTNALSAIGDSHTPISKGLRTPLHRLSLRTVQYKTCLLENHLYVPTILEHNLYILSKYVIHGLAHFN